MPTINLKESRFQELSRMTKLNYLLSKLARPKVK